jgi:two-component system, NarL family, nitrate/nitrite response regulator NarL
MSPMINPKPLFSSQRDLRELTQREIQIVCLVSEGLSNKEIARRMGVSEGTIKFRLHLIYRKLAINNRTSLAMFALRAEIG